MLKQVLGTMLVSRAMKLTPTGRSRRLRCRRIRIVLIVAPTILPEPGRPSPSLRLSSPDNLVGIAMLGFLARHKVLNGLGMSWRLGAEHFHSLRTVDDRV